MPSNLAPHRIYVIEEWRNGRFVFKWWSGLTLDTARAQLKELKAMSDKSFRIVSYRRETEHS